MLRRDTVVGVGGEQRIAVVGSGASGLAAAFQLQRFGYPVDLIEASPGLGGRFGVGTLGDRQVMLGGKNIGRRYTPFRGFVAAMGRHRWEPFGINAARVKDDELLRLDSSRRGQSAIDLLRSGAPRDVGRFLYLLARTRADARNRYLGSPFFTSLSQRHDHAPLSHHFGPDLARNVVRPMVIRMNGAEPDEVYLGTFGTNLALLTDTYDQLTHGIGPVLDAFAERVNAITGTRATDLLLSDGVVRGLRLAPVAPDGEPYDRDYDGVVVATPAYAAAPLVRSARPALADRLGEVRYFPSTVLLVEYDRPVFTPEVRALALDDGPCTNAGSYGADDRHIVRYTFSGRAAREEPTGAQLAEWSDAAEERLLRHIPDGRGAQRVQSVSTHWPAAYSAYLPFHGGFLSDVRRAEAETPGLALAGDYLRGVSIDACFRSGTDAAVALATQLGRSRAGAAAPAEVAA